MSRNLSDDLHNPYLFSEHTAGEYAYEVNADGKSATGSLKIAENPARDSKAQASAGGDLRRGRDNEWGADDGGHLIGARFGGSTGEENLTAQNQNLNRSDYKQMENEWAARLDAGEKVFVHIETDGADRPNAYMGYAIYESPDGDRDYETFHMVNESRSEVAQWEQEASEWESSEDCAHFEEPEDAEEAAPLEEPEDAEEASSDLAGDSEYLGGAAEETASAETSYASESGMDAAPSMDND